MEQYEKITSDRETIKEKLRPNFIGKIVRKEGTSFKNDIKKFIKEDVGLNGIYYNLNGNNHQYKTKQ